MLPTNPNSFWCPTYLRNTEVPGIKGNKLFFELFKQLIFIGHLSVSQYATHFRVFSAMQIAETLPGISWRPFFIQVRTIHLLTHADAWDSVCKRNRLTVSEDTPFRQFGHQNRLLAKWCSRHSRQKTPILQSLHVIASSHASS